VFPKGPLPQSSTRWETENVIAVPHIDGSSVKEWERMCGLFVRNLRAYKLNSTLENAVPKENL
jgi:phosphoglycerate dehydrogenase-like enzyme